MLTLLNTTIWLTFLFTDASAMSVRIVFNPNTPGVFYCPTRNQNGSDKFIVQ